MGLSYRLSWSPPAAVILTAQQKPAGDDSFDAAVLVADPEINATFKTLTARFTETTTSSMLTRPLVASGVVAVERPSRVVLHYQQPELRDVLIDGDRLTVSWPGRHIRDVTNIAGREPAHSEVFRRQHARRCCVESFDIVSERPDDRPRTYRLTMVPRRKQIREGLSRLELWLDQTSLLLAAMRMTFPNGDTKLMVLEDVVLNVPVDPGVFTIGPPPPAGIETELVYSSNFR